MYSALLQGRERGQDSRHGYGNRRFRQAGPQLVVADLELDVDGLRPARVGTLDECRNHDLAFLDSIFADIRVLHEPAGRVIDLGVERQTPGAKSQCRGSSGKLWRPD